MSAAPLPLATVLTRARRALALNFPTALWVRAEVTQLTERRGNRYLTLSQKGEAGELARAGANLWGRDYNRVLRSRGKAAAEVLQAGREVSFQCELELHEIYGLKLRVLDWDPSFTLGQVELERRAVLERLEREGLLGLNAQAASGPVYQRLAVLTSAAAAGYADFREQLAENPYGYAYAVDHYDVAVQGERTVPTVTMAFEALSARADDYDAVCLLRGGGGRLDLASFDRYEIGSAIALCPVPVLVGIGHETDETVPDAVAHTALKTPTALAEHILQRTAQFEAEQAQAARQIARWAEQLLRRTSTETDRAAAAVRELTLRQISGRTSGLALAEQRLTASARQAFAKTRNAVDAAAAQVEALDPQRVLERGYTITSLANGRLAKPETLAAGDALVTAFAGGATVNSTVR